MTIHHVTDKSFNEELQGDGLTVVNFWAPWCGPCKMFAPVIEAYDAEGTSAAKIIKVNIDENQATAVAYGVMSIPSTILFKNSKAIEMKVGMMSQAELKQFVEKHQ